MPTIEFLVRVKTPKQEEKVYELYTEDFEEKVQTEPGNNIVVEFPHQVNGEEVNELCLTILRTLFFFGNDIHLHCHIAGEIKMVPTLVLTEEQWRKIEYGETSWEPMDIYWKPSGEY